MGRDWVVKVSSGGRFKHFKKLDVLEMRVLAGKAGEERIRARMWDERERENSGQEEKCTYLDPVP